MYLRTRRTKRTPTHCRASTHLRHTTSTKRRPPRCTSWTRTAWPRRDSSVPSHCTPSRQGTQSATVATGSMSRARTRSYSHCRSGSKYQFHTRTASESPRQRCNSNQRCTVPTRHSDRFDCRKRPHRKQRPPSSPRDNRCHSSRPQSKTAMNSTSRERTRSHCHYRSGSMCRVHTRAASVLTSRRCNSTQRYSCRWVCSTRRSHSTTRAGKA